MSTFDPIDPKLIDVPSPEITKSPNGHGGYTDLMKLQDTRDVLMQACGAASREFPAALWIEPKDRADKARDNDKHGTWPVNYVDRFTMQDPTHECTCHSLRTTAEASRNRAIGVRFPDGPKKSYRYAESATSGSVWLSCLSVYAEANPQQWGGANVRQVLEIACRRGFIPDKTQPRDYKFKHTLQGTAGTGNSNQSSGKFLRVSQFPDGWQETAKWFKPQEVIFASDWEQALCLVLHGFSYSVGRNGHAVPWTRWNVESQVMEYIDSYNVIRYDSLRTCKSAWSGGFTIATMTTPDNWDEPAGKLAL
jgi:hypothetical protein